MMNEKVIHLRVFSWSRDYELPGFQEQLNRKAKNFLNSQGVNVRILPPPQFGMTGEVSTAIKIISWIVKIAPFFKKISNAFYSRAYKYRKSQYVIFLEAQLLDEKRKYLCDRKAIDMMIMGYELNKYLSEAYPIYEFCLEISICRLRGRKVQISLSGLRSNDKMIGFLMKLIPKLKYNEKNDAYLICDHQYLITIGMRNEDGRIIHAQRYIPYFHFVPLFEIK